MHDLKIDRIIVKKKLRLLQLMKLGEVVKSYSVSLGKEPLGHKEFEGDNKTPEGEYMINDKSDQSDFYKNLGINYPSPDDCKHAEQMGKQPGGLIKIHGFRNDFTGDQEEEKKKDWTAGCIAVTNKEMDEIFELVDVGTPIYIQA